LISRAILHDERLYPEPFIFRPERFIAEDGKAEIEKDPILVGAFGFGRRSELFRKKIK